MSRPKPFTAFSDYLKHKHGQKVHKLSIHAGFTCPNRDGSKGYGGCVYCNNESFSPDAQTSRSVTEQVNAGKKHLKATQNVYKFIAYFQSYTNTYAPLAQLKALYDEALAVPDVIGYSVGTRPDCITPEILDLFADYQRQGKEVFVEYGLESGTDKILDLINRLHSVNEFITAVRWAKDRGLRVIAHVAAQVHAGVRPLAHPARARRAQGMHTGRRRPVGHQPVLGQGPCSRLRGHSVCCARHAALSGQAKGWAC